MRRIPELDGVRGLAALLIVAHHLWDKTLFFGWIAVDVFFVLSGYLITDIILKNGDAPGFLYSFYWRRGLRIWPIYVLTILAAIALTHPEPGAVGYYVSYTQNLPRYWGGRMPVWHEIVHTWTLSLEEQFYLIWPALLLLSPRLARSGITALIVAGAAMVARGVGIEPNLLVARCDGFALGGLLACIVASKRADAMIGATAMAGGAGIISLAWVAAIEGSAPLGDYRPANVNAATFLSFALVALVVRKAGGRTTAWLRSRPLVFLGMISYGLYLYHYPIILRGYSLSIRLGVHDTVAEPFLFATLSLLVAVASWYLIEQPILRLKERFPYRRAVPPSCEADAMASEPNLSERTGVTTSSGVLQSG